MRLPWHHAHPDTPAAAHPPTAVDTVPAARGPEDGPPADNLDQQRRHTAAVAAYGRLLTGTHTVAGLAPGDLPRAARSTADVLAHVSELAATRHHTQPPIALGQFVTARL